MRIPILYQDPDLVVVDKPVGIPTHAPDPGDPYPGDALRIVQAQTGLPYLGMHQRLDADTSGVLLFAARREANRALAAAFEGRSVRKVYLALVHGAPPRAEGVIDAPIVREHGERYRVTTLSDPRGLAARTRYRVVEEYPVVRIPYSVESHKQRPSQYESRTTQYALRNPTRDEPPRPTPSSNLSPKPAGRTRFASIWRTSAARWWVIRFTARPTALRPALFCTPTSLRCHIRRRASG